MYMYWSHQLTQPITVLIHVSLNYVTNCSLKKQIHFIFITKLWYIIIFLHKNKKKPTYFSIKHLSICIISLITPRKWNLQDIFFLMKTTWILYLLKLKQKVLKTYININYPSIIFFFKYFKISKQKPWKEKPAKQWNNPTTLIKMIHRAKKLLGMLILTII